MLKQPTIAEHKYKDHGEEEKKDEENMFVFKRLAQMHKRKVNFKKIYKHPNLKEDANNRSAIIVTC